MSLSVMVLLIVGILALGFVAFEIAGLQIKGLHTISFFAHRNLVLRVLITLLFIVGAVWFWIHSGHDVPK